LDGRIRSTWPSNGLGLGWTWSRVDYFRLLRVTGGKERRLSHVQTLPVSARDRARLTALVPRIHHEKTKLYQSAVNDGAVRLRDGVARFIAEARSAGCRLAIASASTGSSVRALLHQGFGPNGHELFELIVCAEHVVAKKPEPDVYEVVLRHLKLRHDQAVPLEDSPNGLLAADAAGLWTVVTPTLWTVAGHFDLAGLRLPRFGDPRVSLEPRARAPASRPPVAEPCRIGS